MFETNIIRTSNMWFTEIVAGRADLIRKAKRPFETEVCRHCNTGSILVVWPDVRWNGMPDVTIEVVNIVEEFVFAETWEESFPQWVIKFKILEIS